MHWFFLTPFSLAVFNVLVLILFLIIYLKRTPRQSRTTRFLILFFAGVFIVFLSFLFIFSSLEKSYSVFFWRLLHMMVFASAAMVQFAYCFIENLHPRESRIAGWLTLIAAFLAYPYYIYKTHYLSPAYNFDGHLYVFVNTPEMGIVIGAEILWVMLLFLRKANIFSRKSEKIESENPKTPQPSSGRKALWTALIRTLRSKNKNATAMRNFMIIFISPFILVISIIMAYLGLLSWEIVAHILGSGFVIFVFIFIVLYINYSSEPSTFMIKLIGISLGTVLISLGIAGQIALIIKDQAYDKERIIEKRICRYAVQTNNFDDLPAPIAYIAAHSRKAQAPVHILFSRAESASVREFIEKSKTSTPKSKLKDTELRQYRFMPDQKVQYYGIFYTFEENDALYEIGYRYVDYRRYIHESSKTIFVVVIGAVLFIVLIFPVFFNESLIKPLNKLLDGVRVVNEGNLDVVVPVYVYDEIGYLSTSFNRMVKSVSESETELVEALEFQAKLTSSYSYFVPKQLLKLLDRHSIIDIKLGDNIEKKMTILFSDIRSFTSLSEKMTPEQNFYFINNFLKRVGPIVRKHEGYIDKYIGDGIMALFPDSPINAVKASIEMQWVGREYNRQRCMEGQEPIRFGVGVHTGIVMLGTIGEEKRMEGTVISDAVNLASRLEGLTKIYDSSIIVSYNTLAYIKQYGSFRYRFLDRAQVKGKKSWVDIYEILDSYPEDQIEIKLKTKKLFEEATALYFQKRLPEAMGQFKKILAIDPTDKAAQLYINRCQHFIQFGVSPDSNGITPVDEKY